MPILKPQVKLYVIHHLACFETPTEVAASVKEEFGIEIERAHVSLYDPTTHNGTELGVKFKEIFFAVREKFLDDLYQIPEANISVRIKELSKLFRRAKLHGNDVLAAAHLEQIAKEAGGFYSHKLKTDNDHSDSFTAFIRQINGSSPPIVYDVDERFEKVNSETEKQLEKKPKWYPQKN